VRFRKDINGLRAIAVIAVVLFHFNANWMPGGFAGVDVFLLFLVF
jgi:peptidoglycan/LPS O-acetylase OafA/YrhL